MLASSHKTLINLLADTRCGSLFRRTVILSRLKYMNGLMQRMLKIIQQTDEALSQKLDHQNPTLFLQLECLKALLQQIGNGFEYQPTMPPDSIRGSLDRTRDAIQLATSIISRSQKRRRCIDFIACVPKTSREIREWTSTFDEQFQDLEMDLSVWLSAQQIVRQAVSQSQLPVPEPDVLLQPVPDSGFVGSKIKFAEAELQMYIRWCFLAFGLDINILLEYALLP